MESAAQDAHEDVNSDTFLKTLTDSCYTVDKQCLTVLFALNNAGLVSIVTASVSVLVNFYTTCTDTW